MTWTGLVARLLAIIGTAAAVPAAHAAGCTVARPGETTRIAIGDTGRPMLIHLPTGFDPAQPVPLVFLLHGSGGTGAGMLADSGLAATADAHGFIVAAPDAAIPDGKGFDWNIPGVPTVSGKVPGPEAADDVHYIETAIDALAADQCIDRARVYVTGLSGGGRMTSWLGCVAADRFAAIAPVVGLRAGNPWPQDPSRPDPATCQPSRPVPVLAFAGTADTTNPIAGGGAGYWHYSMHAAEQRWAALDGCTAAPTTRWVVAGKIYEERYGACTGGSAVAARVSVGKGHAWVVDNDALWAFLSRYRRTPS
ncbi:MAG: alpha/beta hydrolase family esterase [Sphingomonas sp.]